MQTRFYALTLTLMLALLLIFPQDQMTQVEQTSLALLSGTVQTVDSTLDQTQPVAEYDRLGNYFVVFRTGSSYFGQPGTDLAGGQITASNLSLLSSQSVINGAPDSQEKAVVAYGSNIFLVAWQDLRNGHDHDVYVARVKTDGTVVDPDGILIAGGAHNQMSPSVAFDGESFVVAWANFDGDLYEIRSAKVSLDGIVSDETLQARKADRHSLRPHIFSTRNGLWIFWTEARRSAQLVAKKLPSGETFSFTMPNMEINGPTFAATDGRYVLVIWYLVQEKTYDGADVLGVIWDTDTGTVLTANSTTATRFVQTGGREIPQVFWIEDGTNWGRARPSAGNIRGYNVAYDGKDFWVVWNTIQFRSDNSVAAHRILMRRIDPATGSFYGEQPLELQSGDKPFLNPFMASNGTGQVLLLYQTETDTGQKIIRSQQVR